jgi:predicted nucleic acid-binding protein
MERDEEIPADATTLIYLAKARAYDVITASQLTLLVPTGVWREAVEDGEAAGYMDAAAIREAERASRVRRLELVADQEQRASEIASTHRLGQGESEALAAAEPGGRVLVDDGRATRVAQALGLTPLSTLFLPVLAARVGGMTRRDAVARLRSIATAANARAETVITLEAWIRREDR